MSMCYILYRKKNINTESFLHQVEYMKRFAVYKSLLVGLVENLVLFWARR